MITDKEKEILVLLGKPTLKQFAQNMRYLRKEKKISQNGLGKKIFASQRLVSDIENQKKTPNLSLSIRICVYFNTDLNAMTTTDLSKCA